MKRTTISPQSTEHTGTSIEFPKVTKVESSSTREYFDEGAIARQGKAIARWSMSGNSPFLYQLQPLLASKGGHHLHFGFYHGAIRIPFILTDQRHGSPHIHHRYVPHQSLTHQRLKINLVTRIKGDLRGGGSVTWTMRTLNPFSLIITVTLRRSVTGHVHFANLIRGCIANLGEPLNADALHEGRT